MNTKDFSTTILIKKSPEETFNAINNVRGWWSEDIEGDTTKLNEEFKYHYQDIHNCRIKITELIPGKRIVWLVLDNYFNFLKDPEEWKGTQIIFEISETATAGNKTELRFTHHGLVPQYECYDICSDAWTDFIHDSLKELINTGKGKPNKKEKRLSKK
jgi:hypothetical protein